MQVISLFRGPWLSWLTLLAATAALFVTWYWVWGVILLYWVALEVWRGETFLVQELNRREAPILFWSVLALWTFFGLYFLIAVPFG